MSRERSDLAYNAFKINGVYLEDVVNGYRTLNSQGRETITKELILKETDRADGAVLTGSRFPQREIEIEYFIEAEDYGTFESKFESLTITLCSALRTLDLYNCTEISTTLAISDFTALEELNISNSGINTSSTDISFTSNTSLKKLYMEKITQFTSIDISACTELTELDISGCTGIAEVDLTNCPELANLDVSGTSITILDTTSNQVLESINMSGCTQLQAFQMNSGEAYAQLISIDASECEKLEGVELTNCTALESLEFSNITTLSSLYIYGCTNLTTLNLKGSDNVTVLDVTDVGSEKGSFTVTSTTGTTTATTVPNSTGWDSSYMVSKEE